MGHRLLVRTGLALLLGGGVAAGAGAQSIVRGDIERGVTVTSRPRPDFDPLGVRLGAFRLDANAEAGLGYDSNVFGRPRNVASDGFATQRASASLRSLWTTHAVGLSGNLDARQYFDQTSLTWTDWDIGGFGRYDFSADTNVEGRYRHYQSHLDVYSFDVQSAGIIQPVPYSSDEVQVSGSTRLNRFGLLATGVYRTYRFDTAVLAGVPQQVSLNDFDTTIGALGGSYAIAPGRFVNVILRLQDISYTNAVSRARDSFTWEALAGFQYDFDGVWQGRIAVGWRQRDYSGAQFKTLSGPAVEGSLTWAPTLLTTVRFAVSTSIEESIRRDAVSYRRYGATATMDHELLRNVILTGQLRADRREYESPSQTVTDGLATLGATWLINRNLALVGSYSYQRRLDATGGISEWDRNLLQVRLRVAL